MNQGKTFFRQYRILNGTIIILLISAAIAPLCFEIPGKLKSIIPLNISPPTCLVKENTGQYCKSCGLSRSIIALYHGKWSLSHSFHPLGLFFVIILFLELLFRIACTFIKSICLFIADIVHFLAIIAFFYFSFT